MKKLASTAMIIGALLCSVCSSSVSAALPTQFAVKTWKIDECEGVAPYQTGLYVKDPIELEESGKAVKIKVDLPNGRNPDPNLLVKADLTLFGQQDSASQNVLTQVEAKSLCAAETEEFEEVFWDVLVAHEFKLAYLAGVAALHKPHSDETVVILFLPYVLVVGQPTQFIMAVIPIVDHVHDEAQLSTLSSDELVEILKKKKKKKNHNGIVHGKP